MPESLPPGTTMDYQELCRQTQRAIRESPYTQRAVARALGVSESSVSRACNEPGPTFQRLQRSIIEEILELRIEKTVRFVAREKP